MLDEFSKLFCIFNISDIIKNKGKLVTAKTCY
jgi:hypothetical protein